MQAPCVLSIRKKPLALPSPRFTGRGEERGLTCDQWDREIDEGMMTLNFIKPRAVLEFKTSTQAYFNMPGLDDWSETASGGLKVVVDI